MTQYVAPEVSKAAEPAPTPADVIARWKQGVITAEEALESMSETHLAELLMIAIASTYKQGTPEHERRANGTSDPQQAG